MPGNGPPECVPAGGRSERATCSISADDCQAGLFCWPGVCKRYCDPAGAPCPTIDGSPQRCNAEPDNLIYPNPLGLGVCELDR